MDKQSQIHKADLMDLGLAAALVLASVGFTWYRVDQKITERHQHELLSAQVALANKQTEIRGLESQVVDERTKLLASRGVGLLRVKPGPWQTYTATWYSPEGGSGGGTVTATGTHVQNEWTCAVDPRVIPLGSIIQVRFSDEREEILQALDTGGAIRGNRIDIYCSDEQECVRNGVQKVQVRVLLKGGE